MSIYISSSSFPKPPSHVKSRQTLIRPKQKTSQVHSSSTSRCWLCHHIQTCSGYCNSLRLTTIISLNSDYCSVFKICHPAGRSYRIKTVRQIDILHRKSDPLAAGPCIGWRKSKTYFPSRPHFLALFGCPLLPDSSPDWKVKSHLFVHLPPGINSNDCAISGFRPLSFLHLVDIHSVFFQYLQGLLSSSTGWAYKSFRMLCSPVCTL